MTTKPTTKRGGSQAGGGHTSVKEQKPAPERRTLGKLPVQYRFFLNPYLDARFSSCPECNQKMRQRKLPLFIHVNPRQPIILNKTCKYCPNCDLLIAHQNEIEKLLADLYARMQPGAPAPQKEDYLIVGTLERAAWKENLTNSLPLDEIFAQMHDFKDYVSFKLVGGWGKW
jgi:hypothetical protein